MSRLVQCWKCGATVDDQPLPLPRAAECRRCHADLHVCRMCAYYDPRAARACREPVADPVNDKERSNFCGYFEARPDAHQPPDPAGTQAARAALESVFGAAATPTPETPDAAGARLADLFGLDRKT